MRRYPLVCTHLDDVSAQRATRTIRVRTRVTAGPKDSVGRDVTLALSREKGHDDNARSLVVSLAFAMAMQDTDGTGRLTVSMTDAATVLRTVADSIDPERVGRAS